MFKVFMAIATFLYRISGGRIGGRMNGGDVLLLTTTGRKSGKQRTTPLIYFMDGADYVITASAAGAPKNPGWFFNLRDNPQTMIQVKEKQINVMAEVAQVEKRRQLWSRLIAALPFYASYQEKTTREIPIVLLHPVG